MNLKYKVINSRTQYNKYCIELEDLLKTNPTKFKEEIKLLTLLIENYQDSFENELDPVKLLKELMVQHNMQSKELAELLQLSKATVSKMLNYQKGFSKNTIRLLAEYFSITQEAFNKPYELKPTVQNRKMELDPA
jgi:HTH-type transcriptional regulator / antitoxin HigA